MKIYVAGPMTGYRDHNREAFDAAATDLRERGHEVVNPAELDYNSGIDITSDDGYTVSDQEYAYMLRRDFEHISECDAVALIPGWERSGGVGREGRYAEQLKLKLFLYVPEIPSALMPFGYNTFKAQSTLDRRRPDA